tara:strand:- start:16594 stop:17601 length:1008 start_codon:yes stop_codon:yes gene_type:complete
MVELLSLPREIGLKRSPCSSHETFRSYVDKLNGKANLYTSLYSFRDKDADAPWKYDSSSAIIDRAWWDFDAGERGGIEQVKSEVRTLISRLAGDVRVVATGRGFHIHQLFSRSVMGSEMHRNLARYQRLMCVGLKTLDGFAFPAKLTRIPDTYNTTRGRYAVVIPPTALADDSFKIPNKPQELWKQFCPFFGEPNNSDFDFVLWCSKNPEAEIELESFKGEIELAGEVPIMPCLQKAIEVPNPTHPIRVALVQHMAQELRWFADPKTLSQEQRKSIEETIFQYIKSLGWRDFNEYRTRQGIRTNLSYDNAPSCRWYNQRGMCVGKCWKYDGTIGS